MLNERPVAALATTEQTTNAKDEPDVDLRSILIIVLAVVIVAMCVVIFIKERRRSEISVPSAHKSTSHSASDEVKRSQKEEEEWRTNTVIVSKLDSQQQTQTVWNHNSLSSTKRNAAIKNAPHIDANLSENKAQRPPGTPFMLNMSETVSKQASNNSNNLTPVERSHHGGESSDAFSERQISEVMKNNILNIGRHRKLGTNLGAEGISGSKLDVSRKDSDESEQKYGSNLSVLRRVADASSNSNLFQTKGGKKRHNKHADAASISNLDEIGYRTKGNDTPQFGDASSHKNAMETKRGNHLTHEAIEKYNGANGNATATAFVRTDTTDTNVTVSISTEEYTNVNPLIDANSRWNTVNIEETDTNLGKNTQINPLSQMVHMQTQGKYDAYNQPTDDVILSMAKTKK